MVETNEEGPVSIDSLRKGRTKWPLVTIRMTPHAANETDKIMVEKGVDQDYFLNSAALTEASMIRDLDQGNRVVAIDPEGRIVREYTLINYQDRTGSEPQLPPSSIPFPQQVYPGVPQTGQIRGISELIRRIFGR